MSCRTTAAVFNLSSFSKILIEGPDAKSALEWICTNNIDQPVNTCVELFPFEIKDCDMLQRIFSLLP